MQFRAVRVDEGHGVCVGDGVIFCRVGRVTGHRFNLRRPARERVGVLIGRRFGGLFAAVGRRLAIRNVRCIQFGTVIILPRDRIAPQRRRIGRHIDHIVCHIGQRHILWIEIGRPLDGPAGERVGVESIGRLGGNVGFGRRSGYGTGRERFRFDDRSAVFRHKGNGVGHGDRDRLLRRAGGEIVTAVKPQLDRVLSFGQIGKRERDRAGVAGFGFGFIAVDYQRRALSAYGIAGPLILEQRPAGKRAGHGHRVVVRGIFRCDRERQVTCRLVDRKRRIGSRFQIIAVAAVRRRHGVHIGVQLFAERRFAVLDGNAVERIRILCARQREADRAGRVGGQRRGDRRVLAVGDGLGFEGHVGRNKRFHRQRHVDGCAREVGLIVAVVLLAEHFQRVRAVRQIGGDRDVDRAVRGGRLREASVIENDAGFIRHDRGDVFVLAHTRAGIGQRYRFAGRGSQRRGRHSEVAALVEHRQLPVGFVITGNRRQAVALLAALGGGGEDYLVQIYIQSRAYYAWVIVEHTESILMHTAVIFDVNRVDSFAAGRAQPPVADAVAVAEVIRTAFLRIIRIQRYTGVRRLVTVRKAVDRVYRLRKGQQKHLVLGVAPARGTVFRAVFSHDVRFRNSCKLRFREGASPEAVTAVILTGHVRRAVVAVQPRADGALRPGHVLGLREVHLRVQTPVGEQQQLAAIVREHAPFDRVDVVAAIAVARLLVIAEPDIARLRAGDICRRAVFGQLQRLAVAVIYRQRDVEKLARDVGLLVAVILLVEHLERIAAARQICRDRDLDRAVFSGRLQDAAVIERRAARIRQDRGDVFILAGLGVLVMQRDGFARVSRRLGFGHAEPVVRIITQRQLPFGTDITLDRRQRAVALLAAHSR